MGLSDGASLFSSGIELTKTLIPQWNNLSIYSVIVDIAFLGMLSWLIARIIKGKSHSEPVSPELIPPDVDVNDHSVGSFYETNGDSMREYAYQSSIEGITENWNMGYTETTAAAARDDIAAELQAEQGL